MTQGQRAEALARVAHATQRERLTGDPYYIHLERVVARVESDDEQAVAWLHDILEDTPTTIADLAAAGIEPHVINAVILLTHEKGTPYAPYVQAIIDSGDALALAVKKADMLDHMRPMTWALPQRLLDKYIPAMKQLGLTAA